MILYAERPLRSLLHQLQFRLCFPSMVCELRCSIAQGICMNTPPELICRSRFPLSVIVLVVAFHLCLPKPAYSQRFTFGVKVAGQITNTFTYPFIPGNAHDDRVLFGPTAEIR